MFEKKKWCCSNPYASGIFYEGLALCYTAIECYWLSVFGHYTLHLLANRA